MDTNDIGQIVYLVLLLCVIGGTFLVANRKTMGKTLQQAAIWGLIFVGAIAVAGMWQDFSNTVVPRQNVVGDGGRIEVPRAIDGHYYLTLDINGKPVRFVVDTGASDMVLSNADAAAAGIDPARLAYLGRANTANGTVPIARVTLDSVALGGVVDHAVGASVNGGEMQGSLLGMSYLRRFARLEIAGDTMILER